MTKERNGIKVGLVTICVVAAAFFILLWISKGIGGDMKMISIRFKSSPSMPTLVPGSDVYVGGQKVGKVKEAKLEKAHAATTQPGKIRQAYYVVINAEILEFIQLHDDCKAIADGPPLGGDGIVKIDVGDSDKILAPGQVIDGAEPVGFAATLAGLQDEFNANNPESLLGMIKVQLNPENQKTIMANLLQSMSDMNAVTASLSMELSIQQKATPLSKLHEVADNIALTTATLRSEMTSQEPDALLGKIQVALSSVNDSLASLRSILKTNETPINRTIQNVEQVSSNIVAQTDPNNYDGIIAHFNRAATALSASLEDIKSVTGAAREVVVLNQENLNRMLANFKETTDQIKSGVKYVLRHPWRLLNASAVEDIKQEAIFDAARNFADAATRIDDATTQIKALSEIYGGKIPANHPELVRIKNDLKQTQDNYRRAEEQLWKQLGVGRR